MHFSIAPLKVKGECMCNARDARAREARVGRPLEARVFFYF